DEGMIERKDDCPRDLQAHFAFEQIAACSRIDCRFNQRRLSELRETDHHLVVYYLTNALDAGTQRSSAAHMDSNNHDDIRQFRQWGAVDILPHLVNALDHRGYAGAPIPCQIAIDRLQSVIVGIEEQHFKIDHNDFHANP